jgi:transcriptional regulator with XRE-family HTH domain
MSATVKNRIKEFRKRADLSQAGLAKRVGTSQQQVQRWENGQQVRIDFAGKIAEALGHSIQDVFPGIAKIKLKEPRTKKEKEAEKRFDPALEKSLSEAGLTAHAHQVTWYLRLELKGFKDCVVFPVPEAEAKRVRNLLMNLDEDEPRSSFFVFETFKGLTVAANARELLACRILWDGTVGVEAPNRNDSTDPDSDEEADEEESEASRRDDPDGIDLTVCGIHTIGNAHRYYFHDTYPTEMRDLFNEFEDGEYMSPFTYLTDEDGEGFLLRRDNVALAYVPSDWQAAPGEED